MILTVSIVKPVQALDIQLEPGLLMRRLLAKGFDEIDLVGLSRYHTRLRDGDIVDLMPLRVEDDAEFLALGYASLGNNQSDEPRWHRVYLGDGSFEISAQIVDRNTVHIRIGEYRTAFIPETEGTTITLAEYHRLWNSIITGLSDGLNE